MMLLGLGVPAAKSNLACLLRLFAMQVATPGLTAVQQRAEAVFKLLWKRRQLGKMTTALQAIQCGLLPPFLTGGLTVDRHAAEVCHGLLPIPGVGQMLCAAG